MCDIIHQNLNIFPNLLHHALFASVVQLETPPYLYSMFSYRHPCQTVKGQIKLPKTVPGGIYHNNKAVVLCTAVQYNPPFINDTGLHQLLHSHMNNETIIRPLGESPGTLYLRRWIFGPFLPGFHYCHTRFLMPIISQ